MTSWLHCVSKNHTDVAQYNFEADQPILIIIGTEMLPTEYAIQSWVSAGRNLFLPDMRFKPV